MLPVAVMEKYTYQHQVSTTNILPSITIIMTIITTIITSGGSVWSLTSAPTSYCWHSLASDSTGNKLAAGQWGGVIYISRSGLLIIIITIIIVIVIMIMIRRYKLVTVTCS